MTDLTDLLKSHPEVAQEVKELVAKRLGKDEAKKYAKEAKAYPRFVFTLDGGKREPKGLCTVVNTFGQKQGGTIQYSVGNNAFLVRIDEETEIVVHEPWEAWT